MMRRSVLGRATGCVVLGLAISTSMSQWLVAQEDLLPGTDAPAAGGDATAAAGTATPPPAEDPTPYLAAGDQAIAEKHWREAIDSYLKARLIFSKYRSNTATQDLQLYSGLTEAYRGLKQWQQALDTAIQAQNAARSVGDADPSVWARAAGRAGEIMAKLGNDRIPDAIETFRGAIQFDPNNADLLYNLGKNLNTLGNNRRSQQLPDEGNFDEALQQLNAAIEIRQDHAESYYERGNVNLTLSNVKEGLEDLRKAVELDGTKSKFLARLGQNLLQRGSQTAFDPDGKTADAVKDFREAIGLFGRYIEIEAPREAERKAHREIDEEVPFELKDVYLMRADARSKLAQELRGPEAETIYREVLADCAEAQKQDEEDVELRAMVAYQSGKAHRMLGNLPAALDAFNRAVRAPVRQMPDTLLRRGIVWYRLGDRDMAYRDFKEAAEQGDPVAQFWKGVVHAERGEYSLAVENYSEALRAAPDYVAAYNNRGLAYMYLGMYRRAANDFEELLRRNPNDREAARLRAQAFARLGVTVPANPIQTARAE